MMQREALVFAAVLLGACGSSEPGGVGSGSGTGTVSDGETSTGVGTGGATGGDGSSEGDGATGSGTGTGTGTGEGSVCDAVGPWPDTVDGPYLVSRTASGEPLHSGGAPSLSADGHFVAYHSIEDSTGESAEYLFDIFIYDAACDLTMRVPFEHPEAPVTEAIMPAMAADGSAVAFVSRDENFETQILVYELESEELEVVSVDESGAPVLANSDGPSISGDGRFVAFHTDATLVASDTSDITDVYVYDRDTDSIALASVDSSGQQGTWGSFWPSISGDGRFVAFESISAFVEGINQGPQIYVRDLREGSTEVVSVPDPEMLAGGAVRPSISNDGRYVAWSSSASTLVVDDTNEKEDVFVTDRELGTVERVSVTSTGAELSQPASLPEISGDGDVVVMLVGTFGSGQEPVQLWAKRRSSGELVLLSEGPAEDLANGNVVNPSVSADGTWAAFESRATNLTPPKAAATWDAYAVAVP